MAASRESRRSDTGRLTRGLALAASLPALDAHAHGGDLGLRFLKAIGWSIAAVALAYSAGWIVFFVLEKSLRQHVGGEDHVKAILFTATAAAWLLPAWLFIRGSRRGRS